MESPERIWIENLNGKYRHSVNCSLTDPKLNPEDHRVMDEYIIKHIAQKEFTELHSALKRKEYILQPARDAMQDWDDFNNGKLDYIDSSTPWKAIIEILKREDKK